MCRDEVSKAKGKLELNLTRYTKNNRKGFYTYVKQKRKVKEGVNPLINNADKLVTTEEEKAEAFFFFLPQSSITTSFHASGVDGQWDRDWGNKVPPLEVKIRSMTS